MNKNQLVFNTALIIVQHLRNLERTNKGVHSRLFEHMLHPEFDYVGAGISLEAEKSGKHHPEHVVPCAFMISEIRRLINQNEMTDPEIALLLQKHWKIVRISKDEAKNLDSRPGLKSGMPNGWTFETGDSFARLKVAQIIFRPT